MRFSWKVGGKNVLNQIDACVLIDISEKFVNMLKANLIFNSRLDIVTEEEDEGGHPTASEAPFRHFINK